MTVTEERPQTGEIGLKLFHGTQVSLEKMRIQVSNRLSAISREADNLDKPVVGAYKDLLESLVYYEQRFDDLMTEAAEEFPVYQTWLSHVKGIGPSLAAQLLAMLLPPLVERGPSTWYKAAGLTPSEVDGIMRLPRARVGGGSLTYYPRLRRCLFNVATSFVRTGGYYRDVYDRQKARLAGKHEGDPQWPPHRLDDVARWLMIKLFLSHLYEEWLKAEGKGAGRKAYVLEVLGHTSYIEPPQPIKGKKM